MRVSKGKVFDVVVDIHRGPPIFGKHIMVDASDESIAMLKELIGDDIRTETGHIDITNLYAIREVVRSGQINVIVNCAAYTNVDSVEDNYDLSERLNAKVPESLTITIKEVDGSLVHISTDYVFDKELHNIPCEEGQYGTPTGVYGLTKLNDKQVIYKSSCKYVIIRAVWLHSEFGKNFVRTMLNLTATKPQLEVVFDQVGTPTYAGDLAKAIAKPIEGVCS